MGLVNLTTNLKSLRYGKDRLGGGSSNQPYVKSSIPSGDNVGRTGGPDFLLRGGTLTPGRIIEDGSRLAQMFFDLKSPNGLLFTAKQNILSRSAVATQASGNALNEGIYLPTSTLLAAAGTPLGLHLNKQGLDPTKRTGPDAGQNGLFDLLNIKDPLGLPVYSEFVSIRQPKNANRLLNFTTSKINTDTQGVNVLYEYNGGPGSIVGVGKTQIKLSSERTGENNPELRNIGFFANTGNGFRNYQTLFPNFRPIKYQGLSIFNNPNSVSQLYSSLTATDLFVGNGSLYFDNSGNEQDGLRRFNLSVYNQGTLTTPSSIYNEQKIDAFTQQQIIDKESSKDNPSSPKPDFRKTFAPNGNERIPNSLPYTQFNIEQRVNLGNPGTTAGKDKSSYVKGTGKILDKINGFPLYKSSNVTNNRTKNDLVKFRIGVIDNEDPSKKTYIHFRAFISGMSDSYTADWQGEKFMGRGEKLYRYSGFDRQISLSWKVAAQSKQELIPMYQKLNYLASVCAPDYSKTGYMRGNLITLTVGGYLYEQTGIMTGITYTVPDESPWEISIPDNSNISFNQNGTNRIATDSSVKEMPHIIEVSGFNFIPIHDFVPRVQQNLFSENGSFGYGDNNGTGNILTGHGAERYIALKNGYSENYKGAGASGNIYVEESQEILEAEVADQQPVTSATSIPPVSSDLEGAPSQIPNFGR